VFAVGVVFAVVTGSLVAGASPAPTPSWDGAFSTGSWSQYDGVPGNNPDGNPADFSLTQDPTPAGYTNAFAATLESGTGSVRPGEDGERTLLTLWPSSDDGRTGRTRAYQGADSWYRDEIYFPSTFEPTQGTDFNWLYELHNYPDGPCCANLALSVVTDSSDGGPSGGERLSTRIMGGGSVADAIDTGAEDADSNPDAQVHWIVGPTLQPGRWYDLVWHVHWDWRANSGGGQGLAQYWIDGTEVGAYSGPNLFYYSSLSGPGQAYLQDGYYRPTDAEAGYAQPSVTVYHAATMIGPTAASIGENLP
jgi:Polysaccharide lyase